MFVDSISKLVFSVYSPFVFQMKTGCLREESVLFLVTPCALFCMEFIVCFLPSPFITNTVVFHVSVIACFIASASHALEYLFAYFMHFTSDTM